jgi:hypothetical protein
MRREKERERERDKEMGFVNLNNHEEIISL